MKNKPKKIIKMFVAGSLISATLISLAPNIEYGLTKLSLSGKISVDETNPELKTKQVCQLFVDNINKNDNLDEETKKNVIDSFTTYFLQYYADELSEDTIVNMCAVARTETIKEFSSSKKDKKIYLGTYYSYSNTIELGDMEIDCEYDKKVWAHEQLHAILKSGLFTSGIATWLDGDGINEGITSLIIGDRSYADEQNWAKCIACIIGYQNLKKHYFNMDLDDLISDLSQYATKEKVVEMIYLMDYNLRLGNEIMKLEQNNSKGSTLKKYKEDYNKCWLKIKDIIVVLYEGKVCKNIQDDEFGKVLLHSLLLPPDSFSEECYYTIDFTYDDTMIISKYIYSSLTNKIELSFDELDKFSEIKNSNFRY